MAVIQLISTFTINQNRLGGNMFIDDADKTKLFIVSIHEQKTVL